MSFELWKPFNVTVNIAITGWLLYILNLSDVWLRSFNPFIDTALFPGSKVTQNFNVHGNGSRRKTDSEQKLPTEHVNESPRPTIVVVFLFSLFQHSHVTGSFATDDVSFVYSILALKSLDSKISDQSNVFEMSC